MLEGANIEEHTFETTKWSAYIDSYGSHPLTGIDIKIKDLMKPVCLNRNFRVGQKFHANKSYPSDVAKIFGLVSESDEVKPIIPPPERPASKRMKLDTTATSSKYMLSQTLAPV